MHGGGGMRGGGFHGGGEEMGDHSSAPSSSGENADSSGNANVRAARRQLMNDLMTNPPTLTVLSHDHALKVLTDTSSNDCEARGKFSVSDANGDGERQCGWDGRVWTVETTYSHSFTRTDRYELSGDAKKVTYLTTISGGHMPKIALKRIYLLASTVEPVAQP
jgi:hypothetical protein